jgi:hypothetical protein
VRDGGVFVPIKHLYKPDLWSFYHFAFWGYGYLALALLHVPMILDFIFMFLVGILWELVEDQWKAIPALEPDPRGFDWVDICFDVAGCAWMAFCIHLIRTII